MQFLKIMFWCLLAFVAALFTYGNWKPVPIQLWSGMEALVKLPFLLLVAFLAGLVPTVAYNHAIRWRLRQRLAAAERDAAQARWVASGTGDPTPAAAVAEPSAPPPMAAPIAVPPGIV
jgi:hypothetical protein